MLVQKVESSSEKKSAASSNQAISEPKLAKQSTNLFDVAFVLDCTSSDTTLQMKYVDSQLEISIEAADYSFVSKIKYLEADLKQAQSIQKVQSKSQEYHLKFNDSELEISKNSIDYSLIATMKNIRTANSSQTVAQESTNSPVLKIAINDSLLEVRLDSSKKSFSTSLKQVFPGKKQSVLELDSADTLNEYLESPVLEIRLNNYTLEVRADALSKSFITTFKYVNCIEDLSEGEEDDEEVPMAEASPMTEASLMAEEVMPLDTVFSPVELQ